ncbi:HAD family hydrolase [Provencibacterium massiliense]|uniref:HAD family hydrolase n=1 Tax=Provencibacterium massiliense TaxID=1841868 RepID=UPI001356336A|nr:HAD-IA family hydrolase [Provencibacterium massiliense]
MHYRYIIFDVDDTLIDYQKAERNVFARILADYALPMDDALFDELLDISWDEWARSGLRDLCDPAVLDDYHPRYRRYLQDFFARFAKRLELPFDGEEGRARFLSYFAREREPVAGAVTVCQTLSRRCRLAAATNGLIETQQVRIEPLMGYLDRLFISEALGYIKPDPRFFQKMLGLLGAKASDCLMVGDSLHTDIKGACACGMDSCWLNPAGRPSKEGLAPTYTITRLQELLTL